MMDLPLIGRLLEQAADELRQIDAGERTATVQEITETVVLHNALLEAKERVEKAQVREAGRTYQGETPVDVLNAALSWDHYITRGQHR